MAAAQAATDCPFLQLPTELLGTICDLVTEDEIRPVLRIEIEQDAVTQRKTPQISAFGIGGLSSTCRQLRNEYSAALVRGIEVLMARAYGDDGPFLMDTTNLHFKNCRARGGAAKALQMYASAGPGTRNDNGPVRRVHALAAFIPVEEKLTNGRSKSMCVVGELVVIFVANGSKNDLSSSRISLFVPPQPSKKHCQLDQWPSLEAVAALGEMKQVVRGTKWTGNTRYYMLWFDYVVRYTQDLC
jgi:hypothetical protein